MIPFAACRWTKLSWRAFARRKPRGSRRLRPGSLTASSASSVPAGRRSTSPSCSIAPMRSHAASTSLSIRTSASPAASGAIPARSTSAANSMGRFNTLTSFMSQWSSRSQADGPDNLARTSVPVLHLTYRADQSVFPENGAGLAGSRRPGRIRNVDIHDGDHYLVGRPDLVGTGRRRNGSIRAGLSDSRSGRRWQESSRNLWRPAEAAAPSSAHGLRSTDLSVQAAAGTGRRAKCLRRRRGGEGAGAGRGCLPADHRRRRPHRPDRGLRCARARHPGGAAGRGQHGRRQGRVVARHLLHAEVAGDLPAAGRLRAHRGQGHPVERGPHLRRQRRGLLLRPAPAERLQPVQPAALHQHPAVLHRGLPGRPHPASWARSTCAGRTA